MLPILAGLASGALSLAQNPWVKKAIGGAIRGLTSGLTNQRQRQRYTTVSQFAPNVSDQSADLLDQFARMPRRVNSYQRRRYRRY